jgi:hypothetical protein
MPSVNYSSGIVITSAWLNDVNTFVYTLKTTPNVWTKNQWVTPTVLTYAATINSDANLGNFRVILTGNATLANPTNLQDGMMLNYVIVQDGSGNHTMNYGTKFKFVNGAGFTLSTAAGAVDMISAYYDGTLDILLCVGQKGFA